MLLGTPPPPPPPNVPALPENAEGRTGHVAKPLIGARAHGSSIAPNPTCAGCHKLMDPIGFALENFDAVGVWRTNDSGFAHRCRRPDVRRREARRSGQPARRRC